jgi:hypothetical protein
MRIHRGALLDDARARRTHYIYCGILEGKEFYVERRFTLEYRIDDEWFVGKLKEVPGVFSQGATLHELEENIEDAY